jgi:hypothetical protein
MVWVFCAGQGRPHRKRLTAISDVNRRYGYRRLQADRGKLKDSFKLTLCMVASYPTIYGSID